MSRSIYFVLLLITILTLGCSSKNSPTAPSTADRLDSDKDSAYGSINGFELTITDGTFIYAVSHDSGLNVII